jgi:hypothetical protein
MSENESEVWWGLTYTRTQAIDHDFCSALADHERDTLWVFCSAFGRRNKLHPGPCSKGYDGFVSPFHSTPLLLGNSVGLRCRCPA